MVEALSVLLKLHDLQFLDIWLYHNSPRSPVPTITLLLLRNPDIVYSYESRRGGRQTITGPEN